MMNNISGSFDKDPKESASRKLTPIEVAQYNTLQFVYNLQVTEALSSLSERYIQLKELKDKVELLEETEERDYTLAAISRELKEVAIAIDALCAGCENIAEA